MFEKEVYYFWEVVKIILKVVKYYKKVGEISLKSSLIYNKSS